MFPDIEEIRKARKKYNGKMYRSGIGTFREMEELEANVLRDGALKQKYKELIALGISISKGCYG
jgi:alkylhydroperoxidase/carboxymuconolactone decarboxylase family protein YurZ